MTDEPMVERLTDEELPEPPWTDDEIAQLRENVAEQYRAGSPNPFAACFLATIDALLSQLREQRDDNEELTARIEELLVERLGWDDRADAAERTVREQREALERYDEAAELAINGVAAIAGESYDAALISVVEPLRHAQLASLAALAPDTEGES